MMRDQIADTAKTGALATGGLLAGLGASFCCVLPLALTLIGISGVWIGRLTALAPYQPVFLGVGALAVGSGFWRAYRKRPMCAGGQCGTAASRRWTRTGLWLAAALLLIAATTGWWAPLLA